MKLIELLCTIAIIVVLASMTASVTGKAFSYCRGTIRRAYVWHNATIEFHLNTETKEVDDPLLRVPKI